MSKSTVQIMIALISLSILLLSCDKQDTSEVVDMPEKPSKVLKLDEVTTIATVEAIDLKERMATLKYAEDNFIVVDVADDINLETINVGDKVKMRYLESTAFYVTEPNPDRPAVAKTTTVDVGQGENINKVTVDVVETVQTVESLDLEKRVVVLKDADGKLQTIKVADDLENLENVKVGDQVVTQFTEAFAVSLEKVEE